MSDLTILDDWYGNDALDYTVAWDLQRDLHAQRVAGQIGDTALLLEHPAVFTAGRRTQPHERPIDGSPVVDVDRGGKITWHGRGQLVAYPIVKLPDHVLVVDYVRRMEEAMIRTMADLGVATGRVPGRSGVWLSASPGRTERKIAAIGIRVSRGVTMHGISINADVDLAVYQQFMACGIPDAGVTSLTAELDRRVTVRAVADAFVPHLRDLLAWQPYAPSPDLGSDDGATTDAVSVPVGGLTSRG